MEKDRHSQERYFKLPEEDEIRLKMLHFLTDPSEEPEPLEVELTNGLVPYAGRRISAAKIGRAIGEIVWQMGIKEYHSFNAINDAVLGELTDNSLLLSAAHQEAMKVYKEGSNLTLG